MFPDASKYFAMKSKLLPHEEVSEEEFIQLLIDSGETPDKAKSRAMVTKCLGSSCELGGFLVSIKE